MIVIDKLAYSSELRYKSPALKSAFAVGSLCVCVAARSFAFSLVLLLVMGCLTVRFSQASLSRYMRLMAAPFTFLALGVIAIVVNVSREPLDLFNVAVGSRYLAVSFSSLLYGLQLVAVSLASVSCLYFLTLTTPVLDLFSVLKKLHCPDLIIELMMLIYRYIFVLLDIASQISISQNCRLGNRNLKTAIQSSGTLFSVLLVRALNKSSLLYDAMESRCYDGRINVLSENTVSTSREKAAVAVMLSLLTLLAALCHMRGW